MFAADGADTSEGPEQTGGGGEVIGIETSGDEVIGED